MRKWVAITDQAVWISGQRLADTEPCGAALLTNLYRSRVGDWPKFFKMDALSRLGFLCSELLLAELCEPRCSDGEYRTDRAVLLFGSTSSLCTDSNYQRTISDKENYFPSPAIFVYTLPNIVTGEIAIRNHWRGETTFYLLDCQDARRMASVVHDAFQDAGTDSVFFGWVDCRDENAFCGFMSIAHRGEDSDTLCTDIEEIFRNIKQ